MPSTRSRLATTLGMASLAIAALTIFAATAGAVGPVHAEPDLGQVTSAATAGDAFQWGDAAIGAGVAVALLALLGSAFLILRHYRHVPKAVG
jgi:hypothetical protein